MMTRIHLHIFAVGCTQGTRRAWMSRWEWTAGVIVILHKFDAFQLVEYHFMIGRVPFPFRKCGRDIPCFQSDWGFKLTPGWFTHPAPCPSELGPYPTWDICVEVHLPACAVPWRPCSPPCPATTSSPARVRVFLLFWHVLGKLQDLIRPVHL